MPPATTKADIEFVLLLDDWLAGSPDAAYRALQLQPRMGGMMGPAADVVYDGFLSMADSDLVRRPWRCPRGALVKLRIINGGSSTTFRVGLAGQRLSVVATDGNAVQPVTVD